jgi:Arc/MetJ-type ribon-helix-helix transcriptional regulator
MGRGPPCGSVSQFSIIEMRKPGVLLSIRKSKTRIVSFRLSDEEFCSFRNVCISEGFGSFSELIRAGVQELIANRHGNSAEALHAALERLNAHMEEIGRDVKQLKTSPAEVVR